MRRALLARALGALALLATDARAATTFIQGTDCAANITVTGGLTVASTLNGSRACRANVAKYSGKWYFEATPNATFTNTDIGLSNNGVSQPINGGWSLTPGGHLGGDINGAAFLCVGPSLFWNNTHTTNGAACANGKTIGVTVDLGTDPPQIWATPDVTSLLCDGAGGAGVTAPKWNGACTSDPSIAGTGGPTALGVTGFILPGLGYFPTFQTSSSGGAATFNFGGSAFVIAAVPTGYSSWDTAGGDAPSPGPLSPMTINVANAPVWQQSHAYNLGDRVVAGPGFTQPSTFTNGANLYLWALIAGGGGNSSASGSGPQTCGTPANVGGGLNGSIPTGWSGKTTAVDGALTWVCLTQVDYVTLTGALKDNNNAWTTGVTYKGGDYVKNAGHVYRFATITSLLGSSCVAGASAPTGTVVGTAYSDGTCPWTYEGDITYTSGLNQWPQQTYHLGNTAAEAQYFYDVLINVWYGGQQRQVYQPGQNNEALPLLFTWHTDFGADQQTWCYKGYINNTILVSNVNTSTSYACNGLLQPFYWTLTAATGDSFQENVSPASQALRVDSTRGVTFYSTAAWPVGGPTGAYVTGGEPIAFSDSSGFVTRIQFQSVNGSCVDSHGMPGPGGQHTNGLIFTQGIFDCGDGFAAFAIDAQSSINNSVIFFRGSIAKSTAIHMGYPGPINNNTIICNGATNQTALQNDNTAAGMWSATSAFFPPPFKNNVIINCPGQWAFGTAWASTAGANNATDTASGAATGTMTSLFGGTTLTKTDFPGVGSTCGPPGNASTCFSLTAASQFINPTIGASIDLRVKSPQADIYGAGATFSQTTTGSYFGTIQPGSDVFSTARPISGRYDSGAEMFLSPLAGFMFGPFGLLEPANDNQWQHFAKARWARH